MYLRDKQFEVLSVIAEGNSDGSITDLDEIIDRCRYKPTKEAIQFSLRSLIAHGLVEKVGREKRRGRVRALIAATHMGKHFAAANKPISAIVEPRSLSEVAADLGADLGRPTATDIVNNIEIA